MFSASVEEISDSDSQFSFSNEESSSMHVSAVSKRQFIYAIIYAITNDLPKANTRRCVSGHKRGGG